MCRQLLELKAGVLLHEETKTATGYTVETIRSCKMGFLNFDSNSFPCMILFQVDDPRITKCLVTSLVMMIANVLELPERG